MDITSSSKLPTDGDELCPEEKAGKSFAFPEKFNEPSCQNVIIKVDSFCSQVSVSGKIAKFSSQEASWWCCIGK